MPTSRARDRPSARLLVAALVGALLGASAIMLSPLTPWTTALIVGGIVLLLPSAGVLVVRLLRSL
jgi:predicted phage tail protein